MAINDEIQRLVSEGRLSVAQAAALGDERSDVVLDTIDDGVAVALQAHLLAHKEWRPARRLGLSLRRRASTLKRSEVLAGLLLAQMRLRLNDEAGTTFLQSLRMGDPVLDYRPRVDKASFAAANRGAAASVEELDRERYRRLLGTGVNVSHDRGARGSGVTSATTGGAEQVGTGGLTVWGEVRARFVGARYRFEYGPRPDQLDQATEWAPVPPPRTGHIRERAYRIFGDWVPRSTTAGWQPITEAQMPGEGGRSALCLLSPFAKDRNQLAGIGSHEMPLNMGWCHPVGDDFDPAAPPSYSAGAGVLDLRDAEISFVVAGERLIQRGAAMHLWIGRKCEDDLGSFTSQWALTDQPVPDATFDGSWRRVTVKLPCNPTSWTYTGNNPKEQGEHANRYRRAALHETIECANDAFLLIFAFGPERDPPSGVFKIYEMSARYRDYSVLSPNAGATLASWPQGPCQASFLTDGTRGFDETMWTSEEQPRFPLTFEWSLGASVMLTRLQLNQHLYWPAKNVRISTAGEDGQWRPLWEGEMADASLTSPKPPYTYIPLLQALSASRLRLEILSGHRLERCGLDSIEAYGEGAPFQPDGEPCSVSTELNEVVAGATIYARLVVEDGDTVVGGETVHVDTPATQAPLVAHASGLLRRGNPACVVVRANAMGLETKIVGKLILDRGYVVDLGETNLGTQPTYRHIYFNFPAGTPLLPGKVQLRLFNDAGQKTVEVAWPPA